MNRFFIDPAAINGTSINIPDEITAQIRKVLRLKEGTRVHFLDNRGNLYESGIHYKDEKHLTAEVIQKRPAEGEPECRVILCIALTQRDKFEWILQKCTEAGVAKFVPMITERSLIRKETDISKEKYERWEKILKEAAEQCGRGRIPELMAAHPMEKAVRNYSGTDLPLFCWEEEKQKTLHELIGSVQKPVNSISIMVGPEGGFTEDEAAMARNCSWKPVSLGKRIYRMETAAVVSAALSLYEVEQVQGMN